MAVVPVTLTELVTRITESENLATCREVFRSAEFAVDSWQKGGGFHTLTAALARGLTRVTDIVQQIATQIGDDRACTCRKALEGAVITDPACIAPERIRELDAIAGRVLRPGTQETRDQQEGENQS